MPDFAPLLKLLEDGVAQKVAPHMVLLLERRGEPLQIIAAGEAHENTVFDLASLTKPLCTALLALELASADSEAWERELGEVWGDAVPPDKRLITLGQLLCHAAGFPAHRPFYQVLYKQEPPFARGLLKAMLMNEPLVHAPGAAALYSDLGYMVLGMVLADVSGLALEAAHAGALERHGVEGPRFAPLDQPPPWDLAQVAPCGPLPGREVIHGQVEDENAHALGGVAGHAGLFGTASQVAGVMSLFSRAAQGEGPWPQEAAARLFQVDAATPGSGRTHGFDTPSGEWPAAGKTAPPGVRGHTGFTGTSAWWLPQENSGIVLLTNRVAYGRDNESIREFRTRLHDAAWPLLR